MSFDDLADSPPRARPPALEPPEAGVTAPELGAGAPEGEQNALALATPAVMTAPDKEHANKLMRWADIRQTPNIAEELDAELLQKIGQKVKDEYKIDDDSRVDWLKKSKDAIDLAMQVAKNKTHPWPGSSNVIYPLMTVAAIQFAARAYPAIIQSRNVVKGIVIGDDQGEPQMDPNTGQPAVQQGPNGQPMPVWKVPPGSKLQRAQRIGRHMSWQLLEQMSEWEDETDKLLHILPIIGCCFRKTYFDPGFGCNTSVLVFPQDLVVNYWAKSLEKTPRVSENLRYYPHEIEEFVRAGTFLDNGDYGTESFADSADDKKTPDTRDDDAPRDFIEQHRLLDLDEDGYPEPYIVTIHRATAKVCRIVAGYDPEGVHFSGRSHKVAKIERVHYYTKYDFLPNSDGGFYGFGFGQLLTPINAGVNTTLNMLIDAGHLQNTGGGFIGKGLSMHSGAVRFKPGEYKFINVPGGTIRDAIVPLSFQGPSAVLFQLLGTLIDAGKEIASVKDVLTGEATAGTMQPTTLLALIEQGLKVFTAIYKRVHRGAKKEYDKLYRLNRVYMNAEEGYQDQGEWSTVTREDYVRGSGVSPISDPSMVSDMQRLGMAQFYMTFLQDPHVNPIEIRRRIFEATQVERIEDVLITTPPPPNPEVLAKAMELQIKASREKAGEVKDLSQAILYIAQAEKLHSDHTIEWAQHQLGVVQAMVEHLTGGEGGPGGPQAPGGADGAGGDPAGGGAAGKAALALAAPPGAASEVGAGGGQVQLLHGGARKAKDGNWYLPDPDRPGKFLQVQT